MDGGISVHSSDWFHCSCLLWKGHIMDNWWTLFISQCTAVLLCTIFIYCSLCWNTSSLNTKTEWHYLLAVVICFFFPSQASTALTAQSTPTPHKNTTCTLPAPFHTSKWKLYQGCQLLPTWPCFFFFFLSRQPSEPVLTAQLLIFIFPQNFNYFVPQLSCLSIVSMPIATCSCVVLQWGSQI